MVELNFDRRRPDVLLNLNEVPELRGWSREDGALRLGVGSDLRRGDGGAAAPSSCRRSPRRRARSARRRSGTAARSAATSAPPRRRETRCRRCSSRTRRSRSRPCAGRGRVPLREFLVGPKRNAAAAGRADHGGAASSPSGAPQTFMKVGPRNAMVISVCSLAVVADREREELRASFGSAGGRGPGSCRPLARRRRSPSASSRRRVRSTTCAERRRTAGTRWACSRRARWSGARMRIELTSTARRARPRSGRARACSTRCASGSACPARRTRASRASAARARCCWTAPWSARAWCSRRRPTAMRW